MSQIHNSIFNDIYFATQEMAFCAPTAFINIGTSETAFYLFKHPSGTGKIIKIMQIQISISGGGAIRLYHTPTITSNGTSITPVNKYIKTSPTASVVTPFFTPTISSNGTLLEMAQVSAQNGAIDLIKSPIIIDPNFNLLLTALNVANNTPTHATFHWIEVN